MPDDIPKPKNMFSRLLSQSVEWFSGQDRPPFYDKRELFSNLRAGFTVALVSVPLSFSLALASGAPPLMGIVSAFWSALITAIIGASAFSIYGPTGALVGILLSSANEFKSVAAETGVPAGVIPVISILAGLFIISIWFVGLVEYVLFIPMSVINGFILGVGIIMMLSQLSPAFALENLQAKDSFIETVFEAIINLPNGDIATGIFFFINVIGLILLLKKWPLIPWAIVFNLLGILIGYLGDEGYLESLKIGDYQIDFILLKDEFPSLELSIVDFPELGHFYYYLVRPGVYTSALAVAFIALLETVISAKIADTNTNTEHNRNGEILTLGVVCVSVGVVGGIPANGVVARTSLNILTGATSRMANLINAFAVLLISVVMMPAFKYTPMATTAAILTMVAYRMINFSLLKGMFKTDKPSFALAMLVCVLSVLVDVFVGLVVGSMIAVLMFTKKISLAPADVTLCHYGRRLFSVDLRKLDKEKKTFAVPPAPDAETLLDSNDRANDGLDGIEGNDSNENDANGLEMARMDQLAANTVVYTPTGIFTYVNATHHFSRIKKICKDTNITHFLISLDFCGYLDFDGLDMLANVSKYLEKRRISVYYSGGVYVWPVFIRHPLYRLLRDTQRLLNTCDEALQAIENDAKEVTPR
jgi:SulP family sulfate permease